MTKLYEYATSQRSYVFAAILFFLYLFVGGVYRLYFSPIAKFPGPKLTALTFWVEFYYDITCKGKFFEQIEKWHEQYGPIIRINPYEIHIHDIDFYETLYGNNRLEKWPRQVARYGLYESTFTAISHELHRSRRAVIAPFFSRKSIFELMDVIHESVEKLCARLENFRRQKDPVPMTLAFVALTNDIINEYANGQPSNFLDSPDFAADWHDMMTGLFIASPMVQQSPWIAVIMEALPKKVVTWMNPNMAMMFKYQETSRNQVEMAVAGNYDSANKRHRTIFTDMLESDSPESEKTVDYLAGEAQLIFSAGSVTTAHTMAVMIYHILANPDILAKVRKELAEVMPQSSHEPPSLQELESLPYFTACIQESLRLSYGVAGRLARISRDPIQYRDWVIPAGAPINMSIVYMNRDETAFSDAMTFKPERWLVKEDRERLDRYFSSFSKGPRACLGMYLAWAELYLGMAAILHRFQMDLFETERHDVECEHEFGVPVPRLGSKGVRVLIN